LIGLEILAGSAAGLSLFGMLEYGKHRQNLAKIPTRIHVSGTRGKSSVTRLIAAGLRAGGVRTSAKTTGTLARMILPDGRELPVFRPAGANIIEQFRIVSAATSLGSQALVLECMALQPWLHWISENRLVRATHGIITNARPDHLEIMGPTDADVARCLAGMTPQNGVLYTAERRHIDILKAAADDRRTRLVQLSDDDLEQVQATDLKSFTYAEHRENVALALRVLADFNVGRETALAGMYSARPDPGALTFLNLDYFGRRVVFCNAFAANDPESTATIWGIIHRRFSEIPRTLAVFNLRADRPARTMQLAQATFWRSAQTTILIGTGAYLFAKAAAESGFAVGQLVYAEQTRVEEIFESILDSCGPETLVIGMANIGGVGLGLARYFANRGHSLPQVP
jgi:poly-gamma-glutamate synthase PgsB/CapB